jgi:hypothetical protein
MIKGRSTLLCDSDLGQPPNLEASGSLFGTPVVDQDANHIGALPLADSSLQRLACVVWTDANVL